jgi:ribosomal protein L40E
VAKQQPQSGAAAPIEYAPLAEAQKAAHAAEAAHKAAEAAVANLPEAVQAAALKVTADALAEANGAVALEAAEATRLQNIADAQSAAILAVASLPEAVRASAEAAMLAAIDAQYAPAAPEAEAAPEAAPARGKQVGARQAAVNVAAAEAVAADATRATAALRSFERDWLPQLTGVAINSGTRYPSIVASAAGTANRADYVNLTAQVRAVMRQAGIGGSGNSAATDPWLLAVGPHAASGPKFADSLPLKFKVAAALALHTDGLIRLTLRGTANVRWLQTDATALAQWNGGSASAAAPAAPAASTAPASAPIVPQAPALQADAAGSVVPVETCRHCQTRQPITRVACRKCEAADWRANS